jgi:hypothetical protein
MDHYENPTLLERYLRIVNCAWDMAFGRNPMVVEQGTLLSSVEERLHGYLEVGKTIEPRLTRKDGQNLMNRAMSITWKERREPPRSIFRGSMWVDETVAVTASDSKGAPATGE